MTESWPSGKIFSSLRVLGWLLRRACAGLFAMVRELVGLEASRLTLAARRLARVEGHVRLQRAALLVGFHPPRDLVLEGRGVLFPLLLFDLAHAAAGRVDAVEGRAGGAHG